MEKRIRTGKTLKIGGEDREKLRQEKLRERFQFEKGRMGGYELIFPSNDETRNKDYENFIQKANDLWDDFTTGGKSKKAKEGLEKKTTMVNQRNNPKLNTQSTLKDTLVQKKKNEIQISTSIKEKISLPHNDSSNKNSAREIFKNNNSLSTKPSEANNSQKITDQEKFSERINDVLIESLHQDTSPVIEKTIFDQYTKEGKLTNGIYFNSLNASIKNRDSLSLKQIH